MAGRKTFGKCIGILLASILIGTILMLLVMTFPMSGMRQNVKESLKTFEKEGTYYEVVEGYAGSRLDNFTDAIMVNNVIYDEGESIISRAMNVYRVHYSGEKPDSALILYAKGEEGYSTSIYSRYWHGYLVLLKPLFMFLNYSEIRLLNMAIQFILIAWMAVLLVKRNMVGMIPAFILSYLCLCPMATCLSLQFSTILYITFGGALIVLLNHEKILLKNRYVIFFLIMGILTSFFDLLTYPLLTLGFPLTLYFVLTPYKRTKDIIKSFFLNSFAWGCGYAGMWAGKWLMATMLTGKNIFADAINAVAIRSSNEAFEQVISYDDVVGKNLYVIMKNIPFCVLFIIVLVGQICFSYRNKRGPKFDIRRMLPMVLIMCMPFVWYMVMGNHSYVHFWFTYRTLVVFLFAVLSLFGQMGDNGG